MSLLGIDVGTTGCKTVVFAEDGVVLAGAYREYPLLNPQAGHYELDPNRVWRDVADCLREVNAQVSADPVTALAISTQGEAVIPVGRDGAVLANSPVTADNRASAQTQQLEERLGVETIYQITGQPLSPMYSLPKIMWWHSQQPEVFAKAWKFLCYGDYVALKLGLEPAIDFTMAARMLALDIGSRTWSETVLNAADIDPAKLADVRSSGTVLGTIPAQVAEQLGFQGNVQVVVGGHDQPCAALGAGVQNYGEALYSIGTTEAVAVIMEQPDPTLLRDNLPCYPHVVPKLYITLAGNQTGGRLLRWYRDEFGEREQAIAAAEGRDVYDVIIEQIDDVPSKLMLLPYFAGSGTLYNDPGVTGALLGLTFDTHRSDIVRAFLEGITYEQALITRVLKGYDVHIHDFRAVGGGSKSSKWMQIKADILGVPVSTVKISEAAGLGAVILAGTATGRFASLQQAVQDLVVVEATSNPREEANCHYQELLDRYVALGKALIPFLQTE